MENLFDQVESEVVRGLFVHLTSEEVSLELQDFLESNCHKFEGTLDDLVGEQDLERHALYQEYTDLLDRHMNEYCEKCHLSPLEVFSEFQENVKERGKSEEDFNMTALLFNMLMAAADYNSFLLNMYSFKQFKALAKEDAASERRNYESKYTDEDEGDFEEKLCDRESKY